ncbi:micronuclear linker histone polyprotein-like [Diabrotica virgifera virgifera]|uniref:GATA zinc finger domain-containing protein 14-like n=1 Tax=Diabrotica virgifera virgifera TaxID=50390 RepID=A0ABM5KY02_DIAVI|nr:micronuclear linker histone polyprotein-like [Diabrotica virgifera virgifera]
MTIVKAGNFSSLSGAGATTYVKDQETLVQTENVENSKNRRSSRYKGRRKSVPNGHEYKNTHTKQYSSIQNVDRRNKRGKVIQENYKNNLEKRGKCRSKYNSANANGRCDTRTYHDHRNSKQNQPHGSKMYRDKSYTKTKENSRHDISMYRGQTYIITNENKKKNYKNTNKYERENCTMRYQYRNYTNMKKHETYERRTYRNKERKQRRRGAQQAQQGRRNKQWTQVTYNHREQQENSVPDAKFFRNVCKLDRD